MIKDGYCGAGITLPSCKMRFYEERTGGALKTLYTEIIHFKP